MKRPLADIIAGTRELAALPSTTAQLLRLLDDATVSAGEVLAIIGRDPSLTANLLKLCNSAYYGRRQQVGTVHEALVMLGNNVVVSLAFATSMGDVLRGPLAGYRLARDELWQHSLATAVAAAHLVSAAGSRTLRERAFTAGLVHDIGKLILNAPLVGELRKLPQGEDDDVLLRAERDILGFDHAEAGAALATAWSFPEAMVAVIASHHAPADPDVPPAARVLSYAVAAGDFAACRAGFGAGAVCPSDEVWLPRMAALGVEEPAAGEVLARVPGDLAALTVSLGGRP